MVEIAPKETVDLVIALLSGQSLLSPEDRASMALDMWSRGQASGLESHWTGEEAAVVARGEEQG